MGQRKDFEMPFCLAATNTILETADGEVASLHARLEEADRCVTG